MAYIVPIVGTLLRDILVAEGWRVAGGKASGPCGAVAVLEKEGFDKPIFVPLAKLLAEKRVKAACKYAGISPERFEYRRLACEASVSKN